MPVFADWGLTIEVAFDRDLESQYLRLAREVWEPLYQESDSEQSPRGPGPSHAVASSEALLGAVVGAAPQLLRGQPRENAARSDSRTPK